MLKHYSSNRAKENLTGNEYPYLHENDGISACMFGIFMNSGAGGNLVESSLMQNSTWV